jgi:hypothetical protein
VLLRYYAWLFLGGLPDALDLQKTVNVQWAWFSKGIWGAASGPHGSRRATALSISVLGWLGINVYPLICRVRRENS